MISAILSLIGLVITIEVSQYLFYWKNTGESYRFYKKELKERKDQLKLRKRIRKMLRSVANMSEEELQKKKEEYAKKWVGGNK